MKNLDNKILLIAAVIIDFFGGIAPAGAALKNGGRCSVFFFFRGISVYLDYQYISHEYQTSPFDTSTWI